MDTPAEYTKKPPVLNLMYNKSKQKSRDSKHWVPYSIYTYTIYNYIYCKSSKNT